MAQNVGCVKVVCEKLRVTVARRVSLSGLPLGSCDVTCEQRHNALFAVHLTFYTLMLCNSSGRGHVRDSLIQLSVRTCGRRDRCTDI